MEDKKKQELAVPEFEKLPAEVRANMLSTETSVYFNVALFEQVQRVATLFAKSTMIPERFRNNVGNCMIALNYAHRIKADEFMVFQNLYEVHGTPGIQGKLVEAIINQSGKYSEPLDYEWLDPEDKIVPRREVLKAKVPSEYGCQAVSVDAKSGKRVIGPKITWELIKTRGWYDRKGPDKTLESNNWRTMAEMMFYYRCAAWFANKNCPEKTLGMPTVEELQDVVELKPHQNGSYGVPGNLQDKLKGKAPVETPETTEDIYKYKTEEAKGPETEKKEEEPKKKRTRKKKGEADPPDTPDPIRALYWDLPEDKFVAYVEGNHQGIKHLAQYYQDEIHARWEGFRPNKPFPGTVPDEAVEDIKEETDNPETETKDEKILRLVDGAEFDQTMGQPIIPCASKKTKVGSNWCLQNCEGKAKCKPWLKYNKEEDKEEDIRG